MKFSNHILFLYFLKSSVNPTSPLFVSLNFKCYSLYYLFSFVFVLLFAADVVVVDIFVPTFFYRLYTSGRGGH